MNDTASLSDSIRTAAARPSRLLVFGATGPTGLEILETALAEGHRVTAYVRDPAKLQLSHPRLEAFVGDVLEPDRVAQAVAGHDVVICAIGAPARNKARLRERGTANIVRAMELHQVRRLIVLSSHGIAETKDELPAIMKYLIVPLYLGPAFADHEAQEAIVRTSGLDWTLVRPAHLTNGPATGAYRKGFAADEKTKMKISRADVAGFMLGQVARPDVHATIALSY